MSRFVSTLRAQPTTVRLASNQAISVITIRVQCAEAWDAIRMEVSPETPMREVKHAAMAVLMPDVTDIDEYVVKLHGIEVHAEEDGVSASGVVDGSILLIMSRRRRPVR